MRHAVKIRHVVPLAVVLRHVPPPLLVAGGLCHRILIHLDSVRNRLENGVALQNVLFAVGGGLVVCRYEGAAVVAPIAEFVGFAVFEVAASRAPVAGATRGLGAVVFGLLDENRCEEGEG